MIRAVFLDHSGFFVELEHVCLLFDWWKGELPPLPDKPLLVFVSHRHHDHFDPQIFALDDGTRQIRFLLGRDLKLTAAQRGRWGLCPGTADKCVRLGGGETAVPLPGVTVETLSSTDEGVAFLVTAEGRTLYHAGDLNWWRWAEEGKSWNGTMEANFKRYIEPLRGRRIDLAMAPLDPRQGEDGYLGPGYLLELAEVRVLLPMHQWEDFAFTGRFLARYPRWAGTVLPVEGPGQRFSLA